MRLNKNKINIEVDGKRGRFLKSLLMAEINDKIMQKKITLLILARVSGKTVYE